MDLKKNCDQLTLWLDTPNGTLETKGYYFCGRVRQEELPSGFNKYDIRESDDLDGDMCELAPFVLVNHHGTFITEDDVPCINGADIIEWDFTPWS